MTLRNTLQPSKTRKHRWITAVLAASVSLPLILLALVVVFFNTTLSRNRAASSNLTTANIMSRLVQKSLDDTAIHVQGHRRLLLKGIKSGDEQEIMSELKELLFTSTTIASVALYDPKGKGLFHLVRPGTPGHDELLCPRTRSMNWSNEPWFKDYKAAGGREIVTDTWTDPCTPNYPNAAMVFPLRAAGQDLGVIRVVFDTKVMKTWFEPLKLPKGNTIMLVDSKNDVMYDSATERDSKAARGTASNLPFLRRLAKGKPLVGIFTNRVTGGKEVMAFVPIRSRPWAVLSRQSLDILDRPIIAQGRILVATVLAVATLGFLLINMVRRSYARESRLSNELAVLNEVALDLGKSLDIQSLLERITESTARLLRSDASACFLWLDGSETPTHSVGFNLPGECLAEARVTRGLAAMVLEMPEPLIVADYPTLSSALPSFVAAGAKASVMTPIFIGGKPSGVLGAISMAGTRRVYDSHDVELIEAVARQSGTALENAQLHQQTAHIADTLQRSLLPKKLPDFPGFDFAVFYQSATERALVGGDFYDLFLIPDDRLVVVVGDVSGKGIAATSTAAMVKDTIRAFALEGHTPAEILAQTDAVMSKFVTHGRFITVFLAMVDSSGGFTWVNCGHPPAFLVSGSEPTTEMTTASIPIGLGLATGLRETEAAMEPGSAICIYTDGVTEARSPEGDFFGELRLKKALEESAGQPARDIIQFVFSASAAFSGGTLHDDTAMLVVKRTS